MHFRTLVVVLLMVLLLAAPAESWWRRRRRRRRSPPPPDTTAPNFTSCVSTSRTTSESDGRKVVHYSTPTATDDRGTVTVSRTAGPASGSRFNEGTTTVTYQARDPAGNTASCYVRITVVVLRCPNIPSSSHRSHSCTKTNIAGSVCTFRCPPTGYNLVGHSTSTCLSSRAWNRGFPTCQVKTCSPSLTSLPHGRVTCTNSNRYNSVCTFRCNTCYGFTSGGSTYVRTCGNSWSGTTPTCRDTCAPTLTDCPSGISVEAESALTSAVASWTLPQATDNVPTGVTLSRTQGSAPGSRFNQGSHAIRYQARDAQGNTADCGFSVTVRVITCTPAPRSGNHLIVSCPLGHIKGASCTFGCEIGYRLVGGATRTCQSSGTWSGSQPSCEIRRCLTLTAPSHGSFRDSSSCGNAYGTWCHFECDTGYSPDTASRRCVVQQGQTSVSWSGSPAQCTINTCLTLAPGEGLSPTNTGTCSAGNQVPYGTTCGYTCTAGFRLTGVQTITCGPEGQWLQSLPQCQEITCASTDLPAPANGVKSGCSGDHVPYGTTCTLSCNRGYTPTTSAQRTCRSDSNNNGVWSAGTITCRIVTCSPLSAPAHGSVSSCVRTGQSRSVTARQPFDSRCYLACHTGYTLSSSASRTCLVSGTWDGSATVCTDITAPELQCPPDIVIFAAEGQRVVSIPWNWEPFTGTDAGRDIPAVLLTINSDPVTGSRPTTLEEGTYLFVYEATDSAGNSESCTMRIEAEVTMCLGLQTPDNGLQRLVTGHGSCTEGAVYGSQCEISCETGYTLSTEGATLRRRCMRLSVDSTQGYWNASQPTCVANTCSIPTVSNGYVAGCHGNAATYGDSCEFHCDLGHRTTSGQFYRTRQCQADRSWSGPDFQCLVTVTCPGPFSVPHGSVQPALCSQAATLPYNTVCHFSCGDGFRQDGPAIKTCMDHSSWDSLQNVICIDEQRPRFNEDCPRHVTANSELGSTSQTVTFDPPTASDNSGFVTVLRQTGHPAPGSIFPEERTVVTFFATDPFGNSEQCDVFVTVVVHRCERLQAPASGSINCNRASPIAGTQCTLECNTGYAQSGSHTRTCRLTSDDAPYWDGQTTVCTIVTCPSQPAPLHSIRSGCSLPSEPYGTECSFYCENGYETETSDDGRSRCLADGTWSGTDLVCNEIECPALNPAPGIEVAPPICSSQPVFGHICRFSCSQQGFRIEPVGSVYALCVGNGRWSLDVSEIQCVDVDSPHFTNCPSALTIYADRGTTAAQLDLQIAATDNDNIQPTVTCVPDSGLFNLGDYRISCGAVDAAGNSATCSFQVEVIERVCTALPIPAYGEYVGDCCIVYGCVCHLGCINGYELIGSSEATCEFDGTNTYWQQEETPHCQLITCGALSLPASVRVTPQICTAGSPLAGTLCFFFCLHGLSLIGGVSQASCVGQGLWDVDAGNLPTYCQDLIPPVLTYCPGPTYATRDGPDGVSVIFDVPMARDNNPSGSLTLETSPAGIASPHLFAESTEVSYTFTDEGANSVTCTFRVFVLDDLEPEVVFCPDDYDITALDILTDVTWDEPVFRDPLGHDLVVTNNVAEGNTAILGWGRHTVVYTAVNEDNGQKAACQFAIDITPNSCQPLTSPYNGALSCVPSGRICSAFCNENYRFPRQPPAQFVCGVSSGTWGPHDNVPDCARRRGDTSLPISLMYFSGDCSEQATQDQIATAFITMIQSSPFMNACTLTNKCNIENVQVMCGAGMQRLRRGPGVHRRRRRSTVAAADDPNDDEKWDKMFARLDATRTQRQRRDTDVDFGIFISFDLSYEVAYEMGMESSDAVAATETKMRNEADGLMTSIGNGSLPAPSTPDLAMEVDMDMMSYGDSKVTCKPGYVISNDTLYCTACSSGTWYNQATEECDYCPKGRYQDQQAEESCIACPPGTTTAAEGTKNSSQCKEECPAGSYSDSGIVPCFKCLTGYYQSQPGQTSCQSCPDGTTTLGYGAQSLDHCLEICPPGSYSDTGLVPCLPCEHRYYQPSRQKRHCVLCPGRSTTSETGSISLEQCADMDECGSSPCDHEAMCVDLIDGYRCDCPPGYQGVNCQEDVDDCVDHQCTHGASCVDEVMGYHCLCGPGFQGEFCEVNIDECVSSPCQHDGVCRDAISGYHCQCTSNYHGIHCEQEINSCSPSPCRNGASCELRDGGYRCQCTQGYSGTNCALDTNECSSGPCQNGATCQDMPNAYNCICPTGYEGPHCESSIDWCAESPCHDGSTCVDLVSVFNCVCPLHRSGDLCDETPCRNGARFVETPDSYNCYCVPGYSGHNCEVDISECSSMPCSNGGTCVEHRVNAFSCDCPLGFQGDTCANEVNECSSSPCGAGNVCEDDVNGYICLCGPGLTGTHCEDHIDYCDPTMCQHGATCSNTGVGYRCQCAAGFTGYDCETNIDDCLSMPCQYGGFCVDLDNRFTCFCLAGFMGPLCEININDCSPSACQNGGTCIDGITDYTCICRDGFTGARCGEPVDYCLSSPCQHQGVCQDDPPGYKCSCPPGFVGHNCEENFDECSLYPCVHASSCVDGVNSYSCICDEGYNGINCDVEIDECDSSPCLHGGTCTDLVAGVACLCQEGYSGLLCEQDVDYCTSGPCLNGAACRDEVNGFSCLCQQGWTGDRCEVDIDDCDSDPCENGGECLDQPNAYICHCLPGYSGVNCQEDINECQQFYLQCLNGASCVDKVADFECLCLDGYRGHHCEEEIDECESDPCQNGANCVDEVAAFSCSCPTGFTGFLCEVQADPCADAPCSNGAACSTQEGIFICTCVDGYSGELCDVEIDECASQPCLHQASCEDSLNGYQCDCLPGYTGVHCETDLSTDFDLKFSNPTMSDLIQVTNVTSRDLSSLSMTLWLRSQACSGDFVLAKLSTASSTVIEIRNPSSLRVQLLGHDIAVGSQTDFCDGHWHNLMLTLKQVVDLEWKLYTNQFVAADGAISSLGASVPSGLMLTIGPAGDDPDSETGPSDCQIELSGINIWSNAWSESEVPDIAAYCAPIPPGSVFAWGQVMTLPGAGITRTLRAPAMCGDSLATQDECASSPCDHGGICVDQLGGFLCHCLEGTTGDRCQAMVDFCPVEPCLNDGMCVSELLGFSCQCPTSYTGRICENEIVDGQWSMWLAWSDCSQTCGTGSHLRFRACDDPEPQNGGAQCPGNINQFGECSTDRCPACPVLQSPLRGFIDCNETEAGEIACVIWCRDGYAFSTPPQAVYRCGPSTAYSWGHNPENSLPSCNLMIPRVAVAANITVTYPDLHCSTPSDERIIFGEASATLQNSTQVGPGCLALNTCAANVSVSNCETRNSRPVRAARKPTSAAPVKLTITFTMDDNTVDDDLSRVADNGTTLLETEFDTALEGLADLLQTGEFGIAYEGDVVQPDMETIASDTWDVCPEGSVESEREGYCVQCSKGMIWVFDNEIKDYVCKLCPVNTYKDELDNVCTECPNGMVTIGHGAVNISECFEPPVSTNPEAGTKTIYFVVVAVACVGVILILVAIGLGIFLKLKRVQNRHKKCAPNDEPSPVHIIPDIFEAGAPSNKATSDSLAASPVGDALPETTPTPSDDPDVTGILQLPSTKL